MQNKIDRNYKMIIEALKNATPKAEDLKGMTAMVNEMKNVYKAIPDAAKSAKVMSEAMQPLIKTMQLNSLGLRSREIAELVNAGKLTRIKQGYYQMADNADIVSEAQIIGQLYPDGVICMETALLYYGYGERTPLAWNIAIDRNASKARFNIDYPAVQPHYIEKKHLTYGITDAGYGDCTLKIFDKDRLICECIKNENKMDREAYNKAIQAYINDNEKNIANLLDYAERRNIHKRVKERIGIWL